MQVNSLSPGDYGPSLISVGDGVVSAFFRRIEQRRIRSSAHGCFLLEDTSRHWASGDLDLFRFFTPPPFLENR